MTIITLRGPESKAVIIGFHPNGEAIWGTETITRIREGNGWREVHSRYPRTVASKETK